jgi:hypothetical protein
VLKLPVTQRSKSSKTSLSSWNSKNKNGSSKDNPWLKIIIVVVLAMMKIFEMSVRELI